MRRPNLAALFATALITTAAAAPGMAAVDCSIVNRDLKLGRWPVDVAESMGITLADVNKCKEKASGTTADPGAPPKAGAARSSATSHTAGRQSR